MHPKHIAGSGARDAASASQAMKAKALFWDRIARKYAADPIADIEGYEATLRRLQAMLPRDAIVLELGCGTGSTALRLAGGTRRFVATDVSSEMIAIAREKLAAASLPQLQFAVADAELPAPPGARYDVVLALNVLHLATDLRACIQAARSALKPGGLLVSKTPCLAEMNPVIPRLLIPAMRLIGKAPPVLCFSAEQLRSAFDSAGLEVEAMERHGTKRKDIRVFVVARKPT
jgi:SAM-dependent methyltransferase